MGVHGLATYLRENKRLVAKSLEFSQSSAPKASRTNLVIDGWSFIYKLAPDSQLPWVYGGEYVQLSLTIRRVVEGWLQIGLDPHFVFDGSIKPEKFSTCVDRLVKAPVQNSLLYFRTSTIARSTPRFLNESRLPPPLTYNACVETLQSIDGVHVYFADDEGDPYAVELAGRLGAYVAGQDSDFVVLNSNGYLGYIPLDEMLWTTDDSVGNATGEVIDEDDGEFQTVRKPRRKKTAVATVVSNKQAVGRGIIPPAPTSNISLQASVYSPSVLAQHFKLPTSLLPLLGALVGNDYTASSHNSLLFERRLNVSQRISLAASTLENLLNPRVAPNKKPHVPKSVLQLIEMTVERLANSSYAPSNMIGSVAQAEIVNHVVECTLPYALKGVEGDIDDTVCPLHPPADCTLFYALSSLQDTENPHHPSVISLYLAAFRAGKLAPKIMDVFTTATYWPRLFLEDPDMESTPRSISRHVRAIMYAILENTLGIPAAEFEDDGIDTNTDADAEQQAELDEEDLEDELIDVEDEEDEQDNVEQLRGALRNLSFDHDEREYEEDEIDGGGSVSASHLSEPSSGSISFAYSRRSTGPKVVSEYVRKGTRVIAEEVAVPTELPYLPTSSRTERDSDPPLPLPLQPESDRYTAFLIFLRSDTPLIRDLRPQHLIVVLTLRTVISRLHERAQDAPTSRDRQKEKWSRNEARAFLASFADSSEIVDVDPSSIENEAAEPLEVTPRAIQLVAQTSTTIEAILHLSQVLFLTERVPSCVIRFSGQKFHSLLAGDPKAIPEHEAWPAVLEGIPESCFLEIVGKKSERKKRKSAVGQPVQGCAGPKASVKASSSKNIYALLGDASL